VRSRYIGPLGGVIEHPIDLESVWNAYEMAKVLAGRFARAVPRGIAEQGSNLLWRLAAS
jgi:hypothetical protein